MSADRSWGARLEAVAHEAGSVLCVGIDPLLEAFPRELRPTGGAADVGGVVALVTAMLDACDAHGIMPAAFKPNVGYFAACDQPGNRSAPLAVRYAGMEALSAVMELLRTRMLTVPIILDAKRADIARSSDNYAREAFTVWGADAVTVSPWMGADSVMPFVEQARAAALDPQDPHGPRGVYLLARTSNPGGALLQNRIVDGSPLFEHVLRAIPEWGPDVLGAVVGATAPDELSRAAAVAAAGSSAASGSGAAAGSSAASGHAAGSITAAPFLIPGVGRQGAGAAETLQRLVAAGYPVARARINASSGVLFPWVGAAAKSPAGAAAAGHPGDQRGTPASTAPSTAPNTSASTAPNTVPSAPDNWRQAIGAALVHLHRACALPASGAP